MFVLAAFLLLAQADPTADGMKALEEGKYEAAVVAFTKVIEGDASDYFAHFNLAMAYTLLRKDADAVAEYRKTLALKPKLYEAELNASIVLLRQKNPAEAVAWLEDAASQKPGEFRARYFLAEAQLQTGDVAAAETSFRQAIAIDSKNADAQLGLAQSLMQAGRLSDAEPVFRQAAAMDPRYREYLLDLARLYEKGSQTDEAIAIYREFPDNAAAQARIGELLLESKKYEDALPRLEDAYQKQPDAANRSALAAVYVVTHKLDKAAPLLEKGVAENPADFEQRMLYARVLRDQRQFPAAAAQFYAAAKLKPAEVRPWTELGGMLYMAADLAQALAAFEQAAKNGDASAGNWFLRAIILDKLRQMKPAKEAYERFLSLSEGKNPNQEFQARQRVRILQREIEKR
jgi:Tfp pilus assembly protein PilF